VGANSETLYEVVLPKLGVSIEEGTIVQWYKKEGDQIAKGEPLFAVETEKATVDVEANVSGTISKIMHQKGETLGAGVVVALISTSDEDNRPKDTNSSMTSERNLEPNSKKDIQMSPTRSTISDSKSQTIIKSQSPSTIESFPTEIRASPSARRLMREHSIDPQSMLPFSRGETITAEHVQEFLKESSSGFRITSSAVLSGRRLTIAKRLGQSGVVPVTLFMDTDDTSLNEWRAGAFSEGSKPSLTVSLIPLVAQALKSSPEFNGVFENDTIKLVENINIGIAVDSKDGLIVPVIKNADKLSLTEISKSLLTYEEKVRTTGLSLEDISEGTFTITNLGTFGVGHFTPLINPPQFAILGVGALEDRTSSLTGKISKTLPLSLTFDHRVLDGANAARFLKMLKAKIENSFLKA